MKRILLDTHLLLWSAGAADRLPPEVVDMVENPDIEPLFSTISLLEIAIKHALGRDDFRVDPAQMRIRLLDEGYSELPVLGEHAIAVGRLPLLHRDPFDRLLVAQATVEKADLLTVDARLGDYPGPIRVFS